VCVEAAHLEELLAKGTMQVEYDGELLVLLYGCLAAASLHEQSRRGVSGNGGGARAAPGGVLCASSRRAWPEECVKASLSRAYHRQ
jgi:hypothetical protein